MAPKKKVVNNNTEQKTDFSWTDDELQVLLEAYVQYKSEREYEGVNWDTVRSKYDRLRDILIETYPKENSENYPNAQRLEETITKDGVAAK